MASTIACDRHPASLRAPSPAPPRAWPFLGDEFLLRQLAHRRLGQAGAELDLGRHLVLGQLVGEEGLELIEAEFRSAGFSTMKAFADWPR